METNYVSSWTSCAYNGCVLGALGTKDNSGKWTKLPLCSTHRNTVAMGTSEYKSAQREWDSCKYGSVESRSRAVDAAFREIYGRKKDAENLKPKHQDAGHKKAIAYRKKELSKLITLSLFSFSARK